MEGKDWLLLALAAADGQPLSPAQLQKSLFLLSRAMPVRTCDAFYDFVPYHYGPFNSEIYSDAESLQQSGLVAMTRPAWRRWVEYEATPQGIARAAAISQSAPPELVEYLGRIVRWARSVSFPELIRAIYAQFPDFRVNSVFQD